MKILFIDDHPIMRDGVSSLLRTENPDWNVFTACDKNSALDILNSNTDIKLIILDINLNQKNGLDYISDFKSIITDVKILIYTTYVEPLRIFQAIKSGIDRYVTKGDSTEELIKAVKSIEMGASFYNAETNQLLKNILTEGKYGNDSPILNLFNNFKLLSDKEKTLFNLLATNMTIAEIAEKQKVSEKTISNLSSILYSKMGASGRLDITQMAKMLGLIL